MIANGHPRRLRVAHVSLGLDVGGQERLLLEFARHADRRRFELTFVSLTGRGKLAGALEACGWPVLALQQDSGLRPGIALRLARLFRTQAFDVVHTHDDRPLIYSALAVQLARTGRFVHTQHHGRLPDCSRRRKLLVALAGRLAHTFVCVSHDSARDMMRSGLPRRRVATLWNGIDLQRFAFHGPRPGGPALTVARLSPEKDIANLLRAAALAASSAPDFRLDIAGDGPCREELHLLAAELRLGERVRFLGEVSDIPALLAGASLFVLPSQTEGISVTILEAMAHGLPVVATRVGGNPEVVLAGNTGLLVPPRDPRALAQGILRLWGNAEESQSMARAARRRVEAHFDIRKMVARYETLYCGTSFQLAAPNVEGRSPLSIPFST